MSDIILLDTSIYLNILDIPHRNQERNNIFSQFEIHIKDSAKFLLPLASIWETGNHISRLSSGATRRKYALSLADDVTNALNGNTPYIPTYFPDLDIFKVWLNEFPDTVNKNKSVDKTNEGPSFADHSIIKEWHRTKEMHQSRRVKIWSLDSDLSAYDTGEQKVIIRSRKKIKK